MGDQIMQWSEWWDHVSKWLALEWDQVQGLPHGVLSVVWLGVETLSSWVIGNVYVGIAAIVAVVVIITGRLLRMKH